MVPDEPRLTSLSHGAGCACKLPAEDLRKVLADLPRVDDARVLVGNDTHDDAAVVAVGAEGIISTIDVFMPVVDDPYDFGQIAAANALSDVYAMGGEPLFALAFAGFPAKKLSLATMQRVMQGGAAKCAEAGIAIVGGHTIDDTEPKYGLAVTGRVDPARIVRNSTARPGDVLVLTKPLGIGVLTTAIKRDRATPEVAALAVALMTTLNRDASRAMVEVGVSAATDVTGFGLLGHLSGMLRGSGLRARLWADAVPLLEPARALVADGVFPGGSARNLEFFGRSTRFAADVPEVTQKLLADAQTSGGLLIAVPEARRETLLAALAARGVATRAVIGRLEAADGPDDIGRIDVSLSREA